MDPGPHHVSSTFVTRDLGPAPEPGLARDIAKRALAFSPVAVVACAALWGTAGAASATYAMVLVMANLLGAAWMLATAARISYGALMGAALFGFVLRLALVSAAVLIVRDASWVEPMALGLTLVVAHLGLLFWELRYVSISLAHPGLSPAAQRRSRNERKQSPLSALRRRSRRISADPELVDPRFPNLKETSLR